VNNSLLRQKKKKQDKDKEKREEKREKQLPAAELNPFVSVSFTSSRFTSSGGKK
jgi:hypothetical protein